MSDEEVDEDVMYETESIDTDNSEPEVEPVLEEYKTDLEDIPVTSYPEINLKETLAQLHGQEKRISYEEVLARCTIIKDSDGNIKDKRHITPPFITKYEITKVLGMRATQIEQGAPLFIDIDPNIHDSYIIAKEEFTQKKIPFIIARPLPNGNEEYWKLCDLEILL